jgi:hypothetical protein
MTLFKAAAIAVLAAAGIAPSTSSSSSLPPLPVKLGLYDYDVQESSPVVFNGRLLMVESMYYQDPEYIPLCGPSTSTYLRVRDMANGAVLVNITSSCGGAFGSGWVVANDEGLDTLYIYGTQGRFTGPCWGTGVNCTIDSWRSSDPTLSDASWVHVPGVFRQGRSVFNQDVAHVGAPSAARRASSPSSSPVLPAHQWVMIMEPNDPNDGKAIQFAVSDSPDPTNASAWVALDSADFFLDQLSGWQVGACPSIRYDPATGFYYVLTGGFEIFLLRSLTLARGSWELANTARGAIISPDALDCVAGGAPYAAWYSPSPTAAALMANCTSQTPPFNNTFGFGNDSDVDLSDVLVGPAECAAFSAGGILAKSPGLASLCQTVVGSGEPAIATLFQYGSGDQKSFGFSNLAIAPGRMFDVLASYFAAAE